MFCQNCTKKLALIIWSAKIMFEGVKSSLIVGNFLDTGAIIETPSAKICFTAEGVLLFYCDDTGRRFETKMQCQSSDQKSKSQQYGSH